MKVSLQPPSERIVTIEMTEREAGFLRSIVNWSSSLARAIPCHDSRVSKHEAERFLFKLWDGLNTNNIPAVSTLRP